jgi:acetylornithine deacetylase/succinyl-diaminopimelate desuccinylase-like protein
MEPGHISPCYLTDPHSPSGDAPQRILREVFGGDMALIRGGGSIPILSAFRDVLGAETLLLGLGLPDCRIHSPNENFPVENPEAGIRLNQVLLRELA